MKTKNLVLSALLIAIGTVLHFITPPIIFGVKPDFLLVMAFMGIYISEDLRSAVIIAFTSGIIAALTTSFPMGQIPNILDKLISGLFVYYLFRNANFKVSSIRMAIANGVGTLLSGIIFLFTGLSLIGQLNVFFQSLPVVLITVVINIILGEVLFRALNMAKVKIG